jgi:hypothetical protein
MYWVVTACNVWNRQYLNGSQKMVSRFTLRWLFKQLSCATGKQDAMLPNHQ